MANDQKDIRASGKNTDEDLRHAHEDLVHAKGVVADWERLAKVHKDAYESHEREAVKARAEVERLGAIFRKIASNMEG